MVRGAWQATVHGAAEYWAFQVALVVKNRLPVQETQETMVQCLWEDPLEEGMVTHFSILACRIPRTEKPGRLHSIGLQRVRLD